MKTPSVSPVARTVKVNKVGIGGPKGATMAMASAQKSQTKIGSLSELYITKYSLNKD